MTSEEETFVRAAAGLGLALGPGEVGAFRTYYRALVEWNRKVNLTAITSYPDVLSRHFLDSLTLTPLVRAVCRAGFSPPSSPAGETPAAPAGKMPALLGKMPALLGMVDIGTGAGFPSLPLLIAGLPLQVALVDSVGKKTDFCRHIIDVLGLTGVSVVTARAEDLGRHPPHRAQYDLAVSRAVDHLAVLAEYLLPFCRIGGLAVAMKKGAIQVEIAEAGPALTLLGGGLREVQPVPDLPGLGDDHVLVIVEKIVPTPERYPRRAGAPHKRPLGRQQARGKRAKARATNL